MGSKRRFTLSCLWPERAHNVGNNVTVPGANKPSFTTDVPKHCPLSCQGSLQAVHTLSGNSPHTGPVWRYQTGPDKPSGDSLITPTHIAQRGRRRRQSCAAITLNVWVLQQGSLQTLQDFLDLVPGHTAVTRSLGSTVAVFQWSRPTQKDLHILAYVRQRSSPIQESAEHGLRSPWTCFKVTVPGSSGKGLLPADITVISALAEEGLPDWFFCHV